MNDAGKVAFTPKGDYSSTVTYEYLDTVVYNGNAYAALKTTTGNAPTDSDTDENWKLLARGGTSVPIATEEIAGVVIASSDVGVSDTGSMVLKTDFTTQENLVEITGKESRATFFGKIAKAINTLISHVSTTATTSVLGHVKLTNSVSSTSTSTAAVPASVKKAYDLAASAVPTANISQSSAIKETGTYVLDAAEKNASIEGTIAHDIAELNSNLDNLNVLLDSVAGVIGGTRFTSTHSVSFNNISYAVVNLDITEGYTLPTWCMAIGSINVASGLPVISKITKYSDTQLIIHLNQNVNETLEITLQYTIVKK